MLEGKQTSEARHCLILILFQPRDGQERVYIHQTDR